MRFLKLFILFLIVLSGCKTEEKVPVKENPPSVVTKVASDVTLKNATLNGEVTNEGFSATTDRGFVYSEKNTNPSVSDSKVPSGYGKGVYSIVLDKLPVNTKYYYKAYATNTKGTSYGEVQSFTAADYKLPTVVTDVPKNITYTTVELAGSVTDEGGGVVSESGFVVSTNASPTIIDLKFTVTKGKAAIALIVSKLNVNTKYFVRSYAINEKGIAYGNEQSFTTADYKLSTVVTDVPKNITYTTVELGGSVNDEGGGSVSESGFVVSTNASPTIADLKFPVTKGKAAIGLIVSKLNVNTKYFVRSYAINEKGIAYGNEQSFTTADYKLPTIVTDAPQNITYTTVELGGSVTDEGGGIVSEKGICFGLTPNPVVSDNKIISGRGFGSFKTSLNNLKSSSKYYVRAYAINSKGIAYGNEQIFNTLDAKLTLRDKTTAIVEVISKTGKVWMDRNLGASQVATGPLDEKAFGDLYQWGREADGHQNRSSTELYTVSNSDNPNHSYFIGTQPNWQVPQNNNLWQGVNGKNNPCPVGYRLPTIKEWENEKNIWGNPFDSVLKLPNAGMRANGGQLYLGTPNERDGAYWSSTISGDYINVLELQGTYRLIKLTPTYYRSTAVSVRCIKD